jgi:RNA polymerase sigma-70 factor (ECF subfamily)
MGQQHLFAESIDDTDESRDERMSKPTEDEARLLAAARAGDRTAFASLFLAYEPRLRVLAHRVLRDVDLVEDALQEGALRALRSLDRFEGRASFGTWLYHITYAASIDLLRKRRASDHDAESFELPVRDPAELAVAHLDLAAALDGLTVEQRVVVLLCLQLGFDYRSAADVVGIPEGTVASRLANARTVLLAALGGESEAVSPCTKDCSVGIEG